MRSRGRTPLLLSSVLLLAVGCQPTGEPSAALEAAQALSDQYIAMMTAKNWDMMDELVAPDYVRHDPSAPEPITTLSPSEKPQKKWATDLSLLPKLSAPMPSIISTPSLKPLMES